MIKSLIDLACDTGFLYVDWRMIVMWGVVALLLNINSLLSDYTIALKLATSVLHYIETWFYLHYHPK